MLLRQKMEDPISRRSNSVLITAEDMEASMLRLAHDA